MRIYEWMYLYYEWRLFVWRARWNYHKMLQNGAKSAAMMELAQVMIEYHGMRRRRLDRFICETRN